MRRAWLWAVARQRGFCCIRSMRPPRWLCAQQPWFSRWRRPPGPENGAAGGGRKKGGGGGGGGGGAGTERGGAGGEDEGEAENSQIAERRQLSESADRTVGRQAGGGAGKKGRPRIASSPSHSASGSPGRRPNSIWHQTLSSVSLPACGLPTRLSA